MTNRIAGWNHDHDPDDDHPETRIYTNPLATIALYSSLIGLGLPAFVFGIIGVRQTIRSGENGFGMATWAIVLGTIELVLTAIFLHDLATADW